jgi:hypothetical protein
MGGTSEYGVNTVDRVAGAAAAAAGSVAGAVLAFLVAQWALRHADATWLDAAVVIGGWALISIAAGATAWLATAPFWRYAPITGLSVFVVAGLLVYPAFAIHQLAGVESSVLVVAGSLLAGVVAHWLVVRLDWT